MGRTFVLLHGTITTSGDSNEEEADEESWYPVSWRNEAEEKDVDAFIVMPKSRPGEVLYA